MIASGLLTTLLIAAHVTTRATSPGQEPRTVVHPRFDLTTPSGVPFPSDRFTVDDPDQNTGLRVNLPFPADCFTNLSDCEDITDLNQLDGFHLHPRISIPFDGAIDPSTATSDNIFVIALGKALPSSRLTDGAVLPGRPPEPIVGINRVVWDPETKMLHATADEPLEEHTRYALIVTRGVHDAGGDPIEPSIEFQRYRSNLVGPGDTATRRYRRALLTAELAARHVGVPRREIAVLSVFTSQSATYLLEKIRVQIFATVPPPADFNLGPNGSHALYAFGDIASIVFNQQLTTGPTLTPFVGPNLTPLRLVPGAVGRIAFGRFEAADYMVHPGEFIPRIATRNGTPVVQGFNTLYFNVILPSGPRPPNGWPVAIVGHGRPQHKNFVVDAGTSIVSARGVAQIQINAVGHGFGPLGTLTINRTDGTILTLPAGGRGIDQNGDGAIGGFEGQDASPPHELSGSTDGVIQTIADFMQLVRLIQGGIDVDGDGQPDLDSEQITYYGHSFGAIYGVPFQALTPAIRAGVFLAIGSPFFEFRRLAPANRPNIGRLLEARTPSLLKDEHGLTSIGDVPIAEGPRFNENLPPYDAPPLVNTVPGAAEIQQFLDRSNWLGQVADPAAFAPLLRRAPPSGLSRARF